ncbi:MAG TPA: hypothetical protein VG267_01885 [Terracidiphilus sp.]|jgi:hypothetical protein|nr:hypothetical protein [Terracidiphilus sp.]
MLLLAPPEHGLSLLKIEAALSAAAVAASIVFPRLGWKAFQRIERVFSRLARRKNLAVFLVGACALLRLAILPLHPAPLPFIPDDFSFLLAGDTFAHGRLANPTPAMWTHLETIHVTMQPTYASMYFPGYGLILAAGQAMFHNPWPANVCVDALMCAALCWMLQAWLPPAWALLGGVLSVLRLGLFSYWINTIFGASALPAALGGALVLGALPRLMRTARLRYGVLMAVGLVLLILTRPYEGMLLFLPVAATLAHWAWRGKSRPPAGRLLRLAALPIAIVAAALAWLGYYDWQTFGNPTTLPYTVDRAHYGIVPYFLWQHPQAEPQYRYETMRGYYEHEIGYYRQVHSLRGFVPATVRKAAGIVVFFAAFALLPLLILLHRACFDRRVRLPAVCVGIASASLVMGVFTFAHYLAPFTAAFYALALQAMRHLRLWELKGRPVGKTLVRLSICVCMVTAALGVLAAPLRVKLPEWPRLGWATAWQRTGAQGLERARVSARLEQEPGYQLAIVRYGKGHSPLDEWVYNGADLDQSKVIWARDGEPAAIQEMVKYYRMRRVWLVEPDAAPASVIPYPAIVETPANRPQRNASWPFSARDSKERQECHSSP